MVADDASSASHVCRRYRPRPRSTGAGATTRHRAARPAAPVSSNVSRSGTPSPVRSALVVRIPRTPLPTGSVKAKTTCQRGGSSNGIHSTNAALSRRAGPRRGDHTIPSCSVGILAEGSGLHVASTSAPGGTRASGGRSAGAASPSNVVGASDGSCSASSGDGLALGDALGLGGRARAGVGDAVLGLGIALEVGVPLADGGLAPSPSQAARRSSAAAPMAASRLTIRSAGRGPRRRSVEPSMVRCPAPSRNCAQSATSRSGPATTSDPSATSAIAPTTGGFM